MRTCAKQAARQQGGTAHTAHHTLMDPAAGAGAVVVVRAAELRGIFPGSDAPLYVEVTHEGRTNSGALCAILYSQYHIAGKFGCVSTTLPIS